MELELTLEEVKQHLKDGTQNDYIWIERNPHVFPIYIKDKRILKMEIPIETDDKPSDVWLLNDNTGNYLKKEYITHKDFLTCLNKRHMFVFYIQQENNKYYYSILPRKIIKYIVNIKMLLKCLE